MVDKGAGIMWKEEVLYTWDTGLEFTGGAENRHRKRHFEKPGTVERYKSPTS